VDIVFRRTAEKALNWLPAARRRQIVGRIERLASPLASRRLDIRPLEGATALYRLRVGDYRVLFSVDEAAGTVTIELIRSRGDVYKR